MQLLAALIEECVRQHHRGEFRAQFFYGKNSLMIGDGASARTLLVSRLEDGSVRVLQSAGDRDVSSVRWRAADEAGQVTDGARTLTISEFARALGRLTTLQIVHGVDNSQG